MVVVVATPILWARAKSREGLKQKLGFVPGSISCSQPCVWFHAVSVGEFNAIQPLLNAFHVRHPSIDVVVSTGTASGQKLARNIVGEWAQVVYLPLDAPWAISPWLNRVRPALFVLAETEIWPGLAFQCEKRQIPLVIVNGRISPRSFKSYYALRLIFGSVLRMFKCIAAQTSVEANRYKLIMGEAAGSDQIQIIGNLKFDGLIPLTPQDRQLLRHNLNLAHDAKVLVAGSTHEGEESCLLSVFGKLRKTYSSLKLILVPRHPERFDKVADLIIKMGFKVARFSQQRRFNDGEAAEEVFLLDAIGHLADFYSLADLAFVGGSLVPVGGHNLIEPYLYNVPVISGPHLEKTRDLASELTSHRALLIVSTAETLYRQLDLLLSQKELCREIGERGNALISQSRGATGRALALVESMLPKASETPQENGFVLTGSGGLHG